MRPYTSIDGVIFMTGFLDALEISRAVLAGNSLGGSVALETALVDPQRVQGLTLIGFHWPGARDPLVPPPRLRQGHRRAL